MISDSDSVTAELHVACCRYTLMCFCWSPVVAERPRFTQMYIRLQEYYTSLARFI